MPKLVQPAAQKLYPDYQFPANATWIAALLAEYNLEPIAIKPASYGQENATFYVMVDQGWLVLRVYRRFKKTTAEIREELEFSYYLHDHGIPVPQVVRNTRGEMVTELTLESHTWQAILMECLDGAPIKVYKPELLVNMARLQALSHKAGVVFAEQKGLQTRRRSWSAPLGYAHFDFMGSNLLAVHGVVTGVLDFDDAHYALVSLCLVRTLVNIYRVSGSMRLVRLYLTAYQSVRPLNVAEKLVILSRMVLRYRCAWAVALRVLRWFEAAEQPMAARREA